MPAIELATFQVDDVAVEGLLADRPRMIAALYAAHPALERAYLTRVDDGSFVDVIVWNSREAALSAAAHASEIPVVREWSEYIGQSGGIRRLDILDAYVPSERESSGDESSAVND